jgi:magnesium-protoporphyrin O-methyltransferase
MDNCCRETTDHHFSEARARKDLQAYHRGRLNKTTRILLKALRLKAAESSSLLDIGGGAGVILHEFLDGTAMAATFVEIASAFVQVAREEAEKRGYGGRVRFLHGDFVALAGTIAGAELVTLDRVVCCYPDVEQLIKWWVRLAIRFENWRRRRAGDPFQVHIHSEPLMDELIKGEGYSRLFYARTLTWCVTIYQRHNTP